MKTKMSFLSVVLALLLSYAPVIMLLNGCGGVEDTGNNVVANEKKNDPIQQEGKFEDNKAFVIATIEPPSVNVEENAHLSAQEELANASDEEVLVQTFDGIETPKVDSNGNPLPETIKGEQITEEEGAAQVFGENFMGSFDRYGDPLPQVVVGE